MFHDGCYFLRCYFLGLFFDLYYEIDGEVISGLQCAEHKDWRFDLVIGHFKSFRTGACKGAVGVGYASDFQCDWFGHTCNGEVTGRFDQELIFLSGYNGCDRQREYDGVKFFGL